MQFDPWVEKIWKRKWQPTPVFLPGECHGQRSLAGYSPWGRKRVGHNCAPRLGGGRKGQVEGGKEGARWLGEEEEIERALPIV